MHDLHPWHEVRTTPKSCIFSLHGLRFPDVPTCWQTKLRIPRSSSFAHNLAWFDVQCWISMESFIHQTYTQVLSHPHSNSAIPPWTIPKKSSSVSSSGACFTYEKTWPETCVPETVTCPVSPRSSDVMCMSQAKRTFHAKVPSLGEQTLWRLGLSYVIILKQAKNRLPQLLSHQKWVYMILIDFICIYDYLCVFIQFYWDLPDLFRFYQRFIWFQLVSIDFIWLHLTTVEFRLATIG